MRYVTSPKQLRNFVTVDLELCSTCCVLTGNYSDITAIRFSALNGFLNFIRRAEHANCKLRAFHTTSDSTDGAQRSLTVSLPLMRWSSCTTAFAGILREDTKKERMFDDMIAKTALIISMIPRIFRWSHEIDGSG